MQQDQSSLDAALSLARVALDRKAVAPTLLDLREVADFADFFLIIEGTSAPHVQALADHLRHHAKHELSADCGPLEGLRAAHWVLLDIGDVVIHIFERETRRYYDLEAMWSDATQVEIPGAEQATRPEPTGPIGYSPLPFDV